MFLLIQLHLEIFIVAVSVNTSLTTGKKSNLLPFEVVIVKLLR